MQKLLWLKSFKCLEHSLKNDDSKRAFNLLYELLKNEKTVYRIFKMIGVLQGFIAIFEYFSGYNNKRGGYRPWGNVHSDDVVKDLLEEIRSRKRKTLE